MYLYLTQRWVKITPYFCILGLLTEFYVTIKNSKVSIDYRILNILLHNHTTDPLMYI